VSFEETELGFEYIENNIIYFFGKHCSDLLSLQKKYPLLNWSSVKQVHGNRLVESSQPSLNFTEADAQWTKESNLALITKTADCLPVLGFNALTSTIVSIHAGWRGVANGIVGKSIQSLSDPNSLKSWKLWVGPHIMKNSFSIRSDAIEILKEGTTLPSEEWLIKENDSSYADLSKILESQLINIGLNSKQVEKCFFDTKTDFRFHSFRRDQQLSGRQISFVAKF